jgi:hypothetical protein
VVVLVLAVATAGYFLRESALRRDIAAQASGTARSSPLGDLSEFRAITQDTLAKPDAHDQSGATTSVDDLETAWDKAQARLEPRDTTARTEIDDKIDTVLRALRATSPDPATEKPALTALLTALG